MKSRTYRYQAHGSDDNLALGCAAAGCFGYLIYVLLCLAILVGIAVLIWRAVL